jgi:ABC-type uncharacterized transport system involved in gliding motility auxiliary subunit
MKITKSSLPVIIIIIAIVSIAQLCIPQYWFDITADQQYALDEDNARNIAKIADQVDIVLYSSPELTARSPMFDDIKTRIENMVSLWQDGYGANLTYDVVAPKPFSTQEDMAISFGLEGIPIAEDGSRAYFGLVVHHKDYHQVIAFLSPQRSSLLEYDISKVIFKLASSDKVKDKIALLSALPPANYVGAGHAKFHEALQERFKVEDLSSHGTNKIIDTNFSNYSLVVLVKPENINAKIVEKIKSYTDNGGKLIIFDDPITDDALPMNTEVKDQKENAIDDYLINTWGLRLSRDKIIADYSYSQEISTKVENIDRLIPYLAWLGLDKTAMLANNPIMQDISFITMGSAGAINYSTQDNISYMPLIRSSKRSMLMSEKFVSYPPKPLEMLSAFTADDRSYNMAVLANNDINNSSILYVADTDMLRDGMWIQSGDLLGQQISLPYADNINFIISVINNIQGNDTSLLNLQPRHIQPRLFTKIEQLQKAVSYKLYNREQRLLDEVQKIEAEINKIKQDITLNDDNDENITKANDEKFKQLSKQFQTQLLSARSELRKLRQSAREDVESLINNITLLVLFVPIAIVMLVGLVIYLLRRRKKLEVA